MKKLLLLFVTLVLFCSVAGAQTPQYYVTGSLTGGNAYPWGAPNMQVQLLYKPSMFNTLPPTGFITAVWFRPYSSITPPSSETYTNLVIKLANTSITNVATGPWNPTTLAASYPSYVLSPITGNQWFKVDLQTPFYYNNTQNLIVEVSNANTSTGSSWWYVNTINNSFGISHRLYGATGSSTGNADGAGQPVYEFGIDLFAGYPCTDTPKSLVDAISPICPNKPFSVKPATFYANASYQWQYSDDNGNTWKKHPSAIGLYGDITDAISAPRMYRCIITCIATGLTYTTPPKLIEVAPFYYCYCDNGPTVATGLDIGNVTMARLPEGAEILNNGKATPALSNNTAIKTYTTFQYSVPPTPIYRDSSFSISVSAITSNATMPPAANVAAYIDYNRDGVFQANEKVMKKTITGASAAPNTETATFTVPHTAEIGLTGMRVLMGTGNLDSCGNFSGEGEVEDYLIDLRYEPCTNAANPGAVVSSDSALCPGYDYLNFDTTYEKRKSELIRTWQISADDVVWEDIAASVNKDMISDVFGKQPFFYRVRQVCPRGAGDTTYTREHLIKAKDGYKCYCYSQAVGGTFKDSSDIGGVSIGNYVFNLGGPHVSNPLAYKKRTDHTDDPPIYMYIDSLYKMTVYQTEHTPVHADAKVTIFMDFNNNKQYDIPYERVYTNYTSISNFTLDDTFTVPPVVITGVPTGMRIILNNNIAPNDPSDLGCGAYTSGETHDYIVEFFSKPFPEGINKLQGMEHFGLFPNPATGKFRVQFTDAKPLNEVTVTITTVTGQQVQQHTYAHKGGAFSAELDMSKDPRGVYFVELRAEDKKVMQKLVLQ